MSLTELRQALRRQPFLPFRIQVSDGSTYEIRHPDMMVATVSAVAVASAVGDDPDRYDQLEFIATEHIVELSPIPAGAKGPA